MKFFVFMWVLFLYGFVMAQDPVSEYRLIENSSSGAETGDVILFVFDENQIPQANYEVHVSGRIHYTNTDGYLKISLPKGPQEFTFPDLKQSRKINVIEDLEAEIVLTLISLNKNANFEVSEPQRSASQKIENIVNARSAKSLTSEVDEIVVLMPQNKGSLAALLEVRRKASAVSEVLGSEQMSRQGDSDAASSLRRVTGLTLMGGKYVYVRGLGERYSAVQLNGLSLPSPEPSRRVVPLDLFPTSLLESVVIQKSFSPELPGEFGGGLVSLKTRSLPSKLFGQISLSQSFYEMGNFQTYAGGSTDWWGKDDGSRAMPSPIRTALVSGRRLVEKSASNPEGFTKDELRGFGDSLRKNYTLESAQPVQMPNLTLGLGNRWEYGEVKLGAAGSFLYSSSYDVTESRSAALDAANETSFVVTENGLMEKSEVERKQGGALDFGVEFKDRQKIHLTLMELNDSTDQVSVKEVSGPGVNEFSKSRTRTEWVQRELQVRQLQGTHQVGSLWQRPVELNWKLGSAVAQRDAPDAKEYTYKKFSMAEPYKFDAEAAGNIRTYSSLEDVSLESGIEVQVTPVESLKVRLGISDVLRDRKSDTFRLQYVKDYLAGQEPDLTRSPDEIFADNSKWILVNQTGAADSYSGQQKTRSFYLQTSWSITNTMSVYLGARNEESLQEVRTYYYYAPVDTQALGVIQTRDLLPAYGLVWSPTEKLKSRTTYGETVSRPDFRELSPVRYVDEDTGYDAKGNNQLQGTVIRNFDHRWEFYLNSDEYASAGVFYKKFENPIEDVFEPVAGSLLKVPKNAMSAENKGLELETRLQLRRIHRDLRRFSFVANYSLIDSKVALDPSMAANLTTIDRPLQGQSPYVFNVQLQYDRGAGKTSATLLYNVIGSRITEVGTDYRPDIYEEPFHQLDFVASQKLSKDVSWNFRAKNLLNPELKAVQGAEVVRSQKKDVSVSLGLSMAL